MRPTRAEVDLDAVAANVRRLSAAAGGARLMAVVKADGYGHGAVPVARAALAAGAGWLGVASVEEGLELRLAAVGAPILVLGWTPSFQVREALTADLRLAAVSPEHAADLADAARAAGGRLRVHLKVDTGMGRLGLPAMSPDLLGEAVEAALRVARLPDLELEGVFTHLARSEDDPGFTRGQLELFGEFLDRLERAGVRPPLRHAANSGAILREPGASFDLVRAGISLYGYHPAGLAAPPEERRSLTPAMEWKSAIAQVKEVPAGTPVSYGGTFVTARASRLAVVPVGYADGFSRRLSNRGRVLVNGRRVPVVGRVCMDQVVVDVSEAGEVEVGDEVVLLGRQGQDAIWADEVAAWLDTISYEVLCAIGRRVPRTYRLGDAPHPLGQGGTAERSPAYRWK